MSSRNLDEFKVFFKGNLKAILIDFDDTLVDYRSCADKALHDLFSYSNLNIVDFPDAKEYYDSINRRLWPQLEDGKTTIDFIRCQRFKEMQEKYPIKGEPCDIDVYYRSRFVAHSELVEDGMKFLLTMKERGYRLYVITNGIKETQEQRISNLGLLPILDGYITSEDVGKAKPDPKMIHYALDCLKVSKDQAVVVGDSLNSDIKGAENAGVRSILVNPNLSKNDLDGYRLDLHVNSLSDILRLIEIH